MAAEPHQEALRYSSSVQVQAVLAHEGPPDWRRCFVDGTDLRPVVRLPLNALVREHVTRRFRVQPGTAPLLASSIFTVAGNSANCLFTCLVA